MSRVGVMLLQRFRFRLEKVRQLRESHEEDSRLRLAAANQNLQSAERDLGRCQQDLTAWQQHGLAVLDVGQMLVADALRQAAVCARNRQMALLDECRHQVRQCQVEYLSRRRDHQVLATLKERRLAAHLWQTRQEEQREMDEIGGNGFLRIREGR